MSRGNCHPVYKTKTMKPTKAKDKKLSGINVAARTAFRFVIPDKQNRRNTLTRLPGAALARPFNYCCLDHIVEAGVARTIKVVPGEADIYLDKMSEAGKKAKPMRIRFIQSRVGLPLEFTVGNEDPNLLKYLLATNNLVGKSKNGKGIFKLDEPEKKAAVVMEDDELLTNIKYDIHTKFKMDDDQRKQLLDYAEVIGIKVEGRYLDEIKFDLIAAATRDPQKFINGFSDPSNQNKYIILEAIKLELIKKVDNAIKWTSS